MNLPNFFIIGAAKSGTSSLYMYLNQHPQIFMSGIKEPHFFSYNNTTKITQGPGDKINLAITDYGEYQQLFNPVKNETAIGEASTSYIYRPEAAKRIHDFNPNAKIIAILRQPADRAFSAYMHVVRDQREKLTSFEEALNNEKKRIDNNWEPIWHLTNVGFYYQQLLRYYKFFPEEQISVYLYEELLNNPNQLLKDIFNFLLVDPGFSPDSSVKFNVSGKQKNMIVYHVNRILFNSPNPLRWISRKTIPKLWRSKVTNWIRQKNLNTRRISQKTRDDLIDLFRDDILNLQTLIKKDLSHWLEKQS